MNKERRDSLRREVYAGDYDQIGLTEQLLELLDAVDDAIERAATIAETYPEGESYVCQDIAAAIRASNR